MALATGFSPITDEELDFSNAMQIMLAALAIPVSKADTVCGPCFEGTCEKATDNPQCYCCVSNHVI